MPGLAGILGNISARSILEKTNRINFFDYRVGAVVIAKAIFSSLFPVLSGVRGVCFAASVGVKAWSK